MINQTIYAVMFLLLTAEHKLSYTICFLLLLPPSSVLSPTQDGAVNGVLVCQMSPKDEGGVVVISDSVPLFRSTSLSLLLSRSRSPCSSLDLAHHGLSHYISF
ncbi:hypothetical protein F2Q69_00062657 [Brassica cretica]|uniref:Secreted protein n=1 Tax=Brassica cretica TaxID=69181 RepID=A0A8S9RBE4_BRACR|nr:hypothetical protein F2Q69_00062657 [Brassica cretica]